MSTISVEITHAGSLLSTIPIDPNDVIETNLTISPDGNEASIPKLITIVNIIEKINSAGFELASEGEEDKIAEFLTHYYFHAWEDKHLRLEGAKVSGAYSEYQEEVNYARDRIRKAARDATIGSKTDESVNQIQNELGEDLEHRIRSKPDWWRKIPEILITTGITTLFDCFLGFPLHTLIANILGRSFGLQINF